MGTLSRLVASDATTWHQSQDRRYADSIEPTAREADTVAGALAYGRRALRRRIKPHDYRGDIVAAARVVRLRH